MFFKNAQYLPTKNLYKIYLIDEVHMLSKSSFNALLKTLEEPPGHIKFLLATTDPKKLPVTILSRCLQFNLNKLSHNEILSQLKFIMDSEGLEFEESALSKIADFGNCSSTPVCHVFWEARLGPSGRHLSNFQTQCQPYSLDISLKTYFTLKWDSKNNFIYGTL